MMLMKKYVLLLCALLMSMSLLTGCGGKKEGSNVFISADEDTSDIQSSEAVKGEEKQPLTIYHISDDEIELRFISKELTSVTNINFLAPSDDENGILNPAVGLKLEHTGNEIHPTMTVYNRTMDIEYTIDEYGGEQALEQMSISIDEDAFICSIRHENIIAAFEMVEMWVVDNDEPQSFNGVITEKVSAIVEPVVEGVLPEAFKCCEYDDQYFQPETDDYIVISYEQPVTLFIPVWYKNRTGIYEYGPYRDENTKNSSAKVTYILSFDNENCVNTKIRVEYKSVEEAMQAGLVYNFCICPVTLGYENEPNDELITEEYFEEADQMLFERLGDMETDTLDITYQGHFDKYRYFDFSRREDGLKYVDNIPLCENNSTLAYLPFSSLNHSAGETTMQSITNSNDNYTLTIYNAIEACERYEGERNIEISVQTYDNFLRILISNPTVPNTGLCITKKNKKAHGFGLKNITSCVEKNGGQVDIQIRENRFVLDMIVRAFD